MIAVLPFLVVLLALLTSGIPIVNTLSLGTTLPPPSSSFTTWVRAERDSTASWRLGAGAGGARPRPRPTADARPLYNNLPSAGGAVRASTAGVGDGDGAGPIRVTVRRSLGGAVEESLTEGGWFDTVAVGGSPRVATFDDDEREAVARPISPAEARRAWLSYVWEGGGGLPILVQPRNGDHDDGIKADEGGKTWHRSRMVAPLLFEETILDDNGGDESLSGVTSTKKLQVRYALTNLGLLSWDIEPNSHLGTVEFASSVNGTVEIAWTVACTAVRRRGLWEAVTRQTISQSCDNLASYLAPPQRYTRRTILFRKVPGATTVTPREAMDKWLSFVWDEGGGLPLPLPPLRLGNCTRWIIPPFLSESLVSVDYDRFEIRYRVDNPGWFTYQVHTHEARVRFVTASSDAGGEEGGGAGIDMVWEVDVRPYRYCGGAVRAFTSATISTIARNFKTHLSVGSEATVNLRPPRGGFGGKSMWSVRKDSWLGGVLDAHLADDRSVWDQTVSIAQPWTWGRSQDAVGEGEEWTTIGGGQCVP